MSIFCRTECNYWILEMRTVACNFFEFKIFHQEMIKNISRNHVLYKSVCSDTVILIYKQLHLMRQKINVWTRPKWNKSSVSVRVNCRNKLSYHAAPTTDKAIANPIPTEAHMNGDEFSKNLRNRTKNTILEHRNLNSKI